MRQINAVKRPTEIVAECPLGGTCAHKLEGSRDWVRCVHYHGMRRERGRYQVFCSFSWSTSVDCNENSTQKEVVAC
jgi:hypothetical protein